MLRLVRRGVVRARIPRSPAAALPAVYASVVARRHASMSPVRLQTNVPPPPPPSSADLPDSLDASPPNGDAPPDGGSPPSRLPPLLAIPFDTRPLFPGAFHAMRVLDPLVLEAHAAATAQGQRKIAVFFPKDPANCNTDRPQLPDELYHVGMLCEVLSKTQPDGKDASEDWLVWTERRIQLEELYPGAPEPKKKGRKKSTPLIPSYLSKVSLALVTLLPDLPYTLTPPLSQLVDRTFRLFEDLSNLADRWRLIIATFIDVNYKLGVDVRKRPDVLANFVFVLSESNSPHELQKLLEKRDVTQKMTTAVEWLELCRALLAEDKRAHSPKPSKGLGDPTTAFQELIREKALHLVLPDKVLEVIEFELEKFNEDPTGLGAENRRLYLEHLVGVPWGRYTRDEYLLGKAEKVLEADHYGMEDVKKRILEFIASATLSGSVSGKIICLVGPPGVGKTSITKSLARALNRKYHRVLLGGTSDALELKGHRRTYLGAYPGKLVMALKDSKLLNPVVVLDEVDKMSNLHGHHGNPTLVLLEILDPEQNSAFVDTYLDLPIDLSKVLFVCTANDLSMMPAPVLDRMEIIEVPGYTDNEKFEIGRRYLDKGAKKETGLGSASVELGDDALMKLIHQYCRESGVRNLKKHVEKLYRRVGYEIVRDLDNGKKEEAEAESVAESAAETAAETETATGDSLSTYTLEDSITPPIQVPPTYHRHISLDDLEPLVGKPPFVDTFLYDTPPPGVVNGLAWLSMGGAVLYHEAVLEQPLQYSPRGRISLTGRLGETMKESSNIAYSFARMFLAQRYPHNRFFERANIHLHVLAGATPKDGPLAGITIVTTLLSLALQRSVPRTIAMTGEMSLTGRVLPIGGLREKVAAAKRQNCEKIIFPKQNVKDWEEIPAPIREGLVGVPVEEYLEVFAECFGEVVGGNDVWASEFAEIEKKKREEREGAKEGAAVAAM